MPTRNLTTIVVITHNYGRFLAAAVESAVNQTRPVPVVIMDDGSTDETDAVVRALLARHPGLRIHRSAEVCGLSATRNAAVRHVQSDWVVYLDADDWLDLRFIERGEDWLDLHPGVDVVTTDMTVVREGRRPFVSRSRPPTGWQDLARKNGIVQTSFIRRSVILALDGYDSALDYEDWDFWIRAAKAGYAFGRLPGAHVYRREHGLNKSKTCDEARAIMQIRERHFAEPASRRRWWRTS